MSQMVVTSQGTEKGREIQEHLDRMYDEVIFETFGKRLQEIMDVDADEIASMACQVCGFLKPIIEWSPKYAGHRGVCTVCKHNWPES